MQPAETLAAQLQRRPKGRVPVILQAGSTECGLACLGMVAAAFGQHHSIQSLRTRIGRVSRGMNLTHILQAANTLGMTARAVRTELEGLRTMPVPAILHFDFNHFVVLVEANRRGIVIHDPVLGKTDYSWSEASRHFTGVAIELVPSAHFVAAKADRRPRLRDVMGTVRGLRPALLHVALLAVVLEITALLAPLYVRLVFDQAIPSGAGGMLRVLSIAAGVLVVLHAGFGALRSWAVAWLGTVAQTQWMQQILSHLLRLPTAFFLTRSLGDLSSRIASTDVIQQTLSRQFLEALIDGVSVIFVLAILVSYNAALTAWLVVAVAAASLVRLASLRKQRTIVNKNLRAGADVTTLMLESLRAVSTLKLNNLTEHRVGALWDKQVRRSRIDLQQRHVEILQVLSSDLLLGVLRIVVVAVAASAVIAGHSTVGTLIAFLAYADLFTLRMSALIDRSTDFALLQTHIERLAEITGEAQEECEGIPGASPADASIVLDKVSFRYSAHDAWILNQVSLRIEDGESVAIVGASGCGKSTLAKLVTGLLDPEDGQIRIGGVSLADLGKRTTRDMVACVQQDDELLAGTIAQNIALFDPEADPERIRAAAIAANIDTEIRAMPMRYESLVGDMGAALSGGQKQRIVLARALYRAPRILVLDEATSHLDVNCERAINAAIAGLGITRLIIAHRPETIASASRVIAWSTHAAAPGRDSVAPDPDVPAAVGRTDRGREAAASQGQDRARGSRDSWSTDHGSADQPCVARDLAHPVACRPGRADGLPQYSAEPPR